MKLGKQILVWWLLVVPYILLLYASLLLTMKLRYGIIPHGAVLNTHLVAFTAVNVLWMLIFYARGLFELETLRSWRSVWFALVSAMLVNAVGSIIYFYFQPSLILTPRRFLLLYIAITSLALGLWHTIVSYILKHRLQQPIYLFSPTDELSSIESALTANPVLGFKLMEHFRGLTNTELDRIIPGSTVVMPDNLYVNPAAVPLLYQLRLRAVRFYNHRAFFEQLFRRIYLTDVDELWFLHNIDYKRRLIYDFWKRILDIAASVIGLAVFIVTFPILALLIKLTSKGPIFFTQKRVGKDSKLFVVYKYRTMSGGVSDTWTAVDDPRVTGFGKFLRKSKLDELPQFLNVLRGTMSLVGPRPEQPNLVEALRQQIPFYDERHLVKPGITGWAQLHVYAGNVEETKLKLQYDLYYIKHRSFLFDLEIILKTTYFIFTWGGR